MSKNERIRMSELNTRLEKIPDAIATKKTKSIRVNLMRTSAQNFKTLLNDTEGTSNRGKETFTILGYNSTLKRGQFSLSSCMN